MAETVADSMVFDTPEDLAASWQRDLTSHELTKFIDYLEAGFSTVDAED